MARKTFVLKKTNALLNFELEQLEAEKAKLQNANWFVRRKKSTKERMDELSFAVSSKKEEISYTPSEVELEKNQKQQEREALRSKLKLSQIEYERKQQKSKERVRVKDLGLEP